MDCGRLFRCFIDYDALNVCLEWLFVTQQADDLTKSMNPEVSPTHVVLIVKFPLIQVELCHILSLDRPSHDTGTLHV